MNDNTPDTARRRPLSIPHLVFGLVFVGIAAVRFAGESTDSDMPGSAIGFPIVLIGAGIVGLVATVINARRRRTAYEKAYREAYGEPTPAEAEAETGDETLTEAAAPEQPDTTEATTVIEENDR